MSGFVNLKRVRAGDGPAHRSHRVVRMHTAMSDGVESVRAGDLASMPKKTARTLVDRGEARDPGTDGDARRDPDAQ